VDELHVAVDLCRWMARLRQLLLARARAEAADPDDARALLASVPSTTRSDVANRLLELLQRAAALYARRHSPRDAARRAFDASPQFLDDVTFDLANFSYEAIERLVLAATTVDR
jgi:thioredoxin-like negative regulator of GroEL